MARTNLNIIIKNLEIVSFYSGNVVVVLNFISDLQPDWLWPTDFVKLSANSYTYVYIDLHIECPSVCIV